MLARYFDIVVSMHALLQFWITRRLTSMGYRAILVTVPCSSKCVYTNQSLSRASYFGMNYWSNPELHVRKHRVNNDKIIYRRTF